MNDSKRQELEAAINRGPLEGVKAVLAGLGGDAAGVINSRDDLGNTVLTKAVSDGHLQITRALVEAGGDVMARVQYSGNTPLHIATHKSNAAMIQALIEVAGDKKKPLLDAQNNLGDTAAHIAASNGYVEILQILKEAGADMNIANREGKTVIVSAEETLAKYRQAVKQTEQVLKALGVTPEERAKGDSWVEAVRPATASAVRGV